MKKFARNGQGNVAFGGWEIIPEYAPPKPTSYRRAVRWLIGREDDPTPGRAWVRHTTDTLREAKFWIEDQCSPCPGDIPLQLYGHRVNIREDAPDVLHEVSICSSANGLRKLAQHLLEAADDMDRMGEDFDHVHFQPQGRPEIVICRYSAEHDRPIVWDDALEGFKRES